MQIANPIYDVVFKYLLDDNKIAKLLLSTIIGEEILSLTILPKEKTQELERRSLTVYRLDFSARIKTPKGEKHVIIEIQKAKFPTDIMRFRTYLGEQYRDKDNTYQAIRKNREKKIALPILSIYFLGHKLDHTKAPIIKVKRKYYDVITNKEIIEREDFIESLTHDSFVIQIPHLRKEHKTEIELILSVFDQQNINSDKHILNVSEGEFPDKYRVIIRRLQRAVSEQKVRETMDLEDEVLEELDQLEREIEEQQKTIDEKDKSLKEKDKSLKEKDRIIGELETKLRQLI